MFHILDPVEATKYLVRPLTVLPDSLLIKSQDIISVFDEKGFHRSGTNDA